MDAGSVEVKVVAKSDELDSGLNNAANKVEGFGSKIDNAFNSVKNSGHNLEEFITGFAGGVLGGVLVAAGEKAIEMLKELVVSFGETIAKAAEFGDETGKFAKELGITEERAAGMKQALKAVGLSGDEYASTLIRLEGRLKTQEAAWNHYGIVTRNANGQLLSGDQIMRNALTTMMSYKQGTDQVAFAHEVFGRNVDQAYELIKLEEGAIAENTAKLEDMGYVINGAEQRGEAFNKTIGDLGVTVEDWALTIGQRLMPILGDWAADMEGPLSSGLKILGTLILAVAQAVAVLAAAFKDLLAVATGAINGVTDVVQGLGNAVGAALSGDLSGAGSALSGIFTNAAADGRKMYGSLLGNNAELMKELDGLNGKFAKVGETAAGQGRDFKPDEGNKGGGKSGQAAMDQAVKDYKAINNEKLRSDQSLAEAKARLDQQTNDHELAMGKINASQHAAQAKQIEQALYQSKLQGLQQRAALDAGDAVKHQRDLDEIKKLEADHQAAINRIDNTAAEANYRQQEAALKKTGAAHKAALDKKVKDNHDANQKMAADTTKTIQQEESQWKQLGRSMYSSFTQSLNGMIMGTMTWKQALGQLIDGIAQNFLDMVEKNIENWLFGEATKLGITKATEGASAIGQITSAAGVAGANTFASTSAIPIVGPGMAPAAAAASVASVMSFSSLAFAEKGMVVDRDRLVFAHKDEKILPAGISKGLDELIKTGGGPKKAGDVHLHYKPSINAPQHKNLNTMLREEAHTMRSWINAQRRDGYLKG
jgi:hypothetical protein